MIGNAAALVTGLVAAVVCGGCLSGVLVSRHREARRRYAARSMEVGTDTGTWYVMPETSGIARHMLVLMQRESRAVGPRTPIPALPSSARFDPSESLLRHAGMTGTVTAVGIRRSRMKAVLLTTSLLGLTGAVFTTELSLLGVGLGLFAGCFAPSWALRQEARTRSRGVERHLSEMLEVAMLGLRSGLSLERSLSLYPRYFDTGLSRSVARAVNEWETGLVPREEALRRLARQYDSALLSRVVEDAIRSLRFGSPLADALEQAASEARSQHRARMEERIAKAPVKMMLPVGTLILPAMLLLVMGPVILELMTEI